MIAISLLIFSLFTVNQLLLNWREREKKKLSNVNIPIKCRKNTHFLMYSISKSILTVNIVHTCVTNFEINFIRFRLKIVNIQIHAQCVPRNAVLSLHNKVSKCDVLKALDFFLNF